jgi:hypothetical protein
MNMSPESPQEPDSRRMVVIGLLVTAVLVAGSLLLFYKLRAMSELQDCVMQGRSNCAPVD